MKNLLKALVVTVSLFAFAGCASQSKATGPNGACCNMCPVSNEALPADCEVVDYNGTKVGFCCDKCEDQVGQDDRRREEGEVRRLLREVLRHEVNRGRPAHSTPARSAIPSAPGSFSGGVVPLRV
jgi:hypothetical protein